MNEVKEYVKKNGHLLCLAVAAAIFSLSLVVNTSPRDSERAAYRTGRLVEKRMRILDGHIKTALESDHSQWLELEDLPEDMVVYRYVYDTLQSWCNQFPIINDDTGNRLIFQKFTNLRTSLLSPLAEIKDEVSYMSLGPKWYIVKAVTDSVNCKVIAGLEIKNSLLEDVAGIENGANPNLKLPPYFDICPISDTGGATVSADGMPLFKIMTDLSKIPKFFANSLLRWIALILFMVSAVMYLSSHRSIRTFAMVSCILVGMTALAYMLGHQVNSEFFSPTVYAGGQVLYSFGALTIINTAILLFVICIFLTRRKFICAVMRSRSDSARYAYTLCSTLLITAICVYTHFSLKSLIINSNISLELYLWSEISFYTLLVYLSYSMLFFAILLLIQMLKPVIRHYTGIRYNAFGRKFLFVYAILCAGYLTGMAGGIGFQKEQNRVGVWANRLAVDRDLGVEILLRSVENEIAGDPFISTLTGESMSSMMILNRLTENYLTGISQNYDIIVTLCRDTDMISAGTPDRKRNCLDYFNSRVRGGSPIADNSRFIYVNSKGIPSYIGMFIFYSEKSGIMRMFLEVKPKSYADNRGYGNIPGLGESPGSISMPPLYSYAKYVSGKLITYKGNFAYPTVISKSRHDIEMDQNRTDIYRADKQVHFINWISSSEVIIISRPTRGAMTYFVTFSYLLLITYGFLYLFSKKRRGSRRMFRRNYYRSRINTVMCTSLCLTLIIMTAASVTFVYNRNEYNMYNMMSEKITTIQAMFESRMKYVQDCHAINPQELTDMLTSIGNVTKSDINIYTPQGRIFKATTPEIFDRMILGSRINQDAYRNIVYGKQRFYISREEFAGHRYYSLYAPIFNNDGKMVAILNAPYTDQGYDFKRDAFFHSATIVNLFLILLVATVVVSTTVVNAMFKPILEMGQKMNSTGIHGLEYIIYNRDDEISTLVEAYNRMVHDLSDSTRRLAQGERDKAWSEMARQVAHEIKNPLTPIKLEIQRLIRLKQKNDPSWSTKFDKVAAVVLEHIDILTDTANEFSTFAKLYSEEPVLVDLDKTMREQLTIFDNRENIVISYIGLKEAMVMAPRPQLIRVFVNLLTNAIQAIEIQQKEDAENGLEVRTGHIGIFIRNSVKDGYYDIVFEDDGPGVKEENLGRLFTPNFTTKSAGTGLGLAICRNIVEKCNGEIMYQRSFSMKGACFTVRLPKLAAEQQGDMAEA